MLVPRIRRSTIGTILATVLLSALFGIAGARAEGVLLWVPATIDAGRITGAADLYYEGMAGRVAAVDPGTVAGLVSLGAIRVELAAGETGWIYLVEDADRAEFESGARVLTSAGHEVLVATDGETPQLTALSRERLQGIEQVLRIPDQPIVWQIEEAPPPAGPRDVDPLIQQMVGALSQANFVTTWQTLDDFESRYVYATQNEQATQWILDAFRSFGLQADFHYYEQSGQRRNVVATLPGLVDPTRVVYICGHMDATSDTPYACAPGADDNASGTTTVIEAARVMSQYRFQYTIKFAAFNGEEQGLVGSDAYVGYIYGQGEDVIAAFNCDMVAYRGTDPAPPDLIIYTNTASQAFATTVTNAVSTYLPGLLQPIVHVEALNASDHASFWARGYKAVCSIEDEAWGDDFCPWYHTCNDRIERYPQDYPLYCARTNLAAVAMTALPMNPQGTFYVLGGTVVDDDPNGGSNGNSDGEVNPGETIQLSVTLRNLGQANATHVTGTLASANPDVTILNGTASWNDIPSQGQGTNVTPFRFSVSGNISDGEDLAFTLTMSDDIGQQQLGLTMRAAAPVLGYRSHTLDDATYGNGNGVPDPGEVLLMPVTLANTGGQDAATVTVLLTSQSPNLSVVDGQAGNPMIPSGGVGVLAPPYRIAISNGAVDGEDLGLHLAIAAGFGYTAGSDFEIRVGSLFVDEVEADQGWSLAVGDDSATRGRWTRVDPIGTTQNGSPCQTEDDHTSAPGTICFVTGQGVVGGAPGDEDVDGGKTTLTSPTFDITRLVNPRVSYWRWYTNNLGNNPDEDAWVVQVSSNGGASWVDLERTTASANSWQLKTFALNGVITPTAQVVFHFVATDGGAGGSLVEAAVDDFEIEGDTTPVDVQDVESSLVLKLDPARPNPAAGGTWISFALPAAGPASLSVYGVDGRRMRTVAEGRFSAGPHRIYWDGRSDTGKRLAPGVYFYTLNVRGREITRRISVIR